MNDGIFKWLLIGGAAYLLYEWLNTSTTAAAAATTAYGGTTQPVSTGTAIQYTPPTSAPVSPSTPSLPTVALTSQVGAGAMNALQAIASQPGNVKLSTTGGTTYSGWQWDAMAKAAFGNAYIPLSSIPGVAGATQYSIGGYVQAYLQALQASVQGMSGLGADPRQMSREVRDRLMRQHLNQRATNRPVIHLAPTSRGRIVDKNYWGDGARSKRQIPYTWVQ